MSGIKLQDAGDGIRILSIDNAQKKNALNNALCAELSEKVRELGDDKEARVLIVTGEGGSFCAGADLPDVFGTMGDDVNDIRDHLADTVYQSFLGLRDLKIPVISAVEGPAVGAGLNMALAADVVIASPTADFAATFSKIGLHQGGGCTALLVETLGRQRAMKLILEGGRLTGQEAYDLGMVAALADDPLDAALELATHIFGVGGLESRLSERVRQKEGLTYGIGASLSAGYWGNAGSFAIQASFAPDKRERVIAVILEEMKRMAAEGITAAELARARQDILEGRRQGRADPGALVGGLTSLAERGETWAAAQKRDEALAAVTVEQANAAWRKHIDPAAFVISTAGDFKTP